MIDNYVMIGTFITSIVALVFALKKQKHDTDNVDVDTIDKLYDLIKKQDKRYDELKCEFETYKTTTNQQLADMAGENVKLRRWATRLTNQLEQAGLVPVRYE